MQAAPPALHVLVRHLQARQPPPRQCAPPRRPERRRLGQFARQLPPAPHPALPACPRGLLRWRREKQAARPPRPRCRSCTRRRPCPPRPRVGSPDDAQSHLGRGGARLASARLAVGLVLLGLHVVDGVAPPTSSASAASGLASYLGGLRVVDVSRPGRTSALLTSHSLLTTPTLTQSLLTTPPTEGVVGAHRTRGRLSADDRTGVDLSRTLSLSLSLSLSFSTSLSLSPAFA